MQPPTTTAHGLVCATSPSTLSPLARRQLSLLLKLTAQALGVALPLLEEYEPSVIRVVGAVEDVREAAELLNSMLHFEREERRAITEEELDGLKAVGQHPALLAMRHAHAVTTVAEQTNGGES